MDWNNINRDRDTSGLGPIEYDQSRVPSLIRKHADNVRTKTYGQEVREAQARNAELAGLIASEADNKSTEADILSKDTQKRFKDQISGTTNSDEVIDARRPFNKPMYATLGDRLDDEFEEVTMKQPSLMLQSTFETMPYINSRNDLYSFEAGNNEKDLTSLKVTSQGYESATGNKDFAFNLTESILPNEKILIKMKVFPTESTEINVRLAYSSGNNVSLGDANVWNDVNFELDTSSLNQPSNYLYINVLKSTFFYIYSLEVINMSKVEESNARSINQLNRKIDNQPKIIQNDLDAINRLIRVGQTYYDNISDFIYGNFLTAYDANTQRNGQGKFEMDCSSFVSLVLHGVEFQNSRYAGNQDNVGKPNFFNDIDSYKYRYTHNMARHFVENGYAFKPNDDFSNIQAGDMLFFNWNDSNQAEAKPSLYMGIEHVGIFLSKNNDNDYKLLQYYERASGIYYDATSSYMSQCVLVARVPFYSPDTHESENLVANSNQEISTVDSIDIGFYTLIKPMEYGKYYTAIIEGSVADPGYLILQAGNNKIFSDSREVAGDKDKYYFTFPYLFKDSVPNYRIKFSMGNNVKVGSVQQFELYEGLKQIQSDINPYADILTSNLNWDAMDQKFDPHLYSELTRDGLKVSISLSFKNVRSGTLDIGQLPYGLISKKQRVPAMLVDETGAINAGAAIFNVNGGVNVVAYNTAKTYKHMLINGTVIL